MNKQEFDGMSNKERVLAASMTASLHMLIFCAAALVLYAVLVIHASLSSGDLRMWGFDPGRVGKLLITVTTIVVAASAATVLCVNAYMLLHRSDYPTMSIKRLTIQIITGIILVTLSVWFGYPYWFTWGKAG